MLSVHGLAIRKLAVLRPRVRVGTVGVFHKPESFHVLSVWTYHDLRDDVFKNEFHAVSDVGIPPDDILTGGRIAQVVG